MLGRRVDLEPKRDHFPLDFPKGLTDPTRVTMNPTQVTTKRVHSRVNYLLKKFTALLEKRKLLVKRFLRERNACLLNDIRRLRNVINANVEKAKSECIRTLLGATKNDPKRFWRNIKSMINGETVGTEHVIFKDPNTGLTIYDSMVPNLLNDYFANISERVCDPLHSKVFVPDDVPPSRMFFFIPPPGTI